MACWSSSPRALAPRGGIGRALEPPPTRIEAIAAAGDRAAVLDSGGMFALCGAGASPHFPPARLGNDGATQLRCGDQRCLVAHRDRLDAWSLAVDEAYGSLAVAPLASLALAAAPVGLCPAPGAGLGLLVLADGGLWYFNATAAHDEDFVNAAP